MYMHVCIYTYGYHVPRLLLERNGVDRLLSAPILVTDHHRGEQLERTGNVRHIQQPVQHRMELGGLKLSVRAIGRRQLELGHPIRMIVQDEMHQLVGEEAEDVVHREQYWLGQAAGRRPGQVLHRNAQIAPLGMAQARPSLHKAQSHGARRLRAHPYVAAHFCGHAAFTLLIFLAIPVATSQENIFGIQIRVRGMRG